MKKKIIGLTVIVASAIATCAYFQNDQEVSLSEFAVENMEALGNQQPSSSECPNSGDGCIIVFSDGTMSTIEGAHT